MKQTTHLIYVIIIYFLLISPQYVDALLSSLMLVIAPEAVAIVPSIRMLFITIPVMLWMLYITYKLKQW